MLNFLNIFFDLKTLIIICKWYFLERPITVIRSGLDYISAISSIFSFAFLLKTLFVPWKNRLLAYPERGFQVQKILQIFITNMVARVVGAVVRLGTIIFGFGIVGLVGLYTGLYLVIWYTFPLSLFFGVKFVYEFFSGQLSVSLPGSTAPTSPAEGNLY